jgi:hypothetical protein
MVFANSFGLTIVFANSFAPVIANLFASEANHKKAVFLPEMREKWLFLFQQWAIYSM